MKTQLLAAVALAATLAAPIAQAMEQEHTMLTGAVYNALRAQGFDANNIDKLTLGEIAIIKSLLEESDMAASTRQQIKKILDK